MTASPKKRRAADTDRQDQIRPAFQGSSHEGHQRKDAAFSVIVGPKNEQHIFDRYNQCQRPENQRDDAKNIAADKISVA